MINESNYEVNGLGITDSASPTLVDEIFKLENNQAIEGNISLLPSSDSFDEVATSDDIYSSSPAVSEKEDQEQGRGQAKGKGVMITQDTDPVPFSSTPDLGSRTASSTPDSERDPPTPVWDPFVRVLHEKLEALVESGTKGCRSAAVDCEDEEADYSGEECKSADEYETTPSTATTTTNATTAGAATAKSYQQKRKYSDSFGSECSTELASDNEEEQQRTTKDKDTHPNIPVSKKLRETSFSYSATEAASIRRAHSLSISSTSLPQIPRSDSPPSGTSFTPVCKKQGVPIIAPPPYEDIPRAPLSADDAAEARLKILLEKEESQRQVDGFEKGFNAVFDKDITQEEVDDLLGLDEDFRTKAINWLLQVTPSKKLGVNELRNQLRTSPETRFHAILLFSRYFLRVGDAMPIATKKETPLMRLGRQRIAWNVAVSCLALAVKFNRDFLSPLNPVYTREFLAVAPHPMSHDDLEISQKDVLQALDYEIRGITPEPLMEEIWYSLPSLRKVLEFEDGWDSAKTFAWQRLNTAASTSEMLQFPISVLTTSAILEGLQETLVSYLELTCDDVSDEEVEVLEGQAKRILVNVIKDIKDLMKIASVDLKRCRKWLRKIHGAV